VARVLIRSPEAAATSLAASGDRRSWLKPGVWLAGVAGVVIVIVGTLEIDSFRRALAFDDFPRIEQAAKRLRWIGRSNSEIHRELGRLAVARKDWAGAERELGKSLALRPHPQTQMLLGRSYSARGQHRRARDAFAAAYELDPFPTVVIQSYARALLGTGDPQRAREVLRAGLTQHPGDPALQDLARKAERRLTPE
jgi:tetratricopeptide (TPR) repeat protein